MKRLQFIIILLIPTLSFATEQRPDLLIFNEDSIWIYEFPLEILEQQENKLLSGYKNDDCIVSVCWRQLLGTWIIENDRLFLIEIRDCCDDSVVQLSSVFTSQAVNNNRVFASWFSTELTTGFGRILEFDEEKWENIYEHQISLTIENGDILKLKSSKR